MNIMAIFRRIGNAYGWLKEKKNNFDRQMKNQYVPKRLALLSCLVIALLASIMLFVPSYLGLSNDGSFDAVLADTNLERIVTDDDTPSVNYYERTYLIQSQAYSPDTTPFVLRFMVTLAVEIDTLFTRDFLFDMRVLAFLYLLLYLPAVYSIIHFALRRVNYYSEGLLLSLLCILIFADVSTISRFASLYTQPIEYIAMLYLAGGMFHLLEPKQEAIRLVEMVASALVLLAVNAYCSVAVMVISALCWYCMLLHNRILWRFGCLVLAVILCVFSVIGLYDMQSQITVIQQYNAMTRGVLFQASNPVEALSQFGIDSRYSVLAGTYGDQNYPVVLPESGLVDEGFLDEYTTGDIFLYHISHPMELLGMFDIGVQNAFNTRPDYAGNYEESVGKAALSKSPFMAFWAQFKADSAPKTYYVFAGLIAGLLILINRGQRNKVGRKESKHLSVMICGLVAFVVVELITVFIVSGDSELMRETYLMSCFVDLLALLFVTEVIHKLDIIRGEDEK